MLASGLLLARSVRRFRADWRAAEVARVAVRPRQTVRLPAAGDLRLFLEGPRLRTWGKQLTYVLANAETGAPVPIQPSFTGTGVRSLRRSRVERGRFHLPLPASVDLQIGGLEPSDPERFEIVFMRPFTERLLRFVLTCVGLAMILVGSLVLAILSLALS